MEHQYFYKAIDFIVNNRVKKKKDLADLFNISPSKLSEILKNRMNPGIDLYKTIVLEFDINPEWLLTGRGEMLLGELPVSEDCKEMEIEIRLLKQQLSEKEKQLALTHQRIGTLEEKLRSKINA